MERHTVFMIGRLSKLIYRLNTIPNKITTRFFFFKDIDKVILKVIWKGKETSIAKTTLKKKGESLYLIYYIATTVIRTGIGT